MPLTYKDTISVRPGEELDKDKVERFLRRQLSDLPEAPLKIEQFPSGHSNLTYALQISNWEAVLRKRPLGPVAAKAHDMKRESFILQEIHPFFPLAPKPILYYENSDLIGSEFFIMERRRGIVIDTQFPEEIVPTKEMNETISNLMVESLVKLHDIDFSKTKLLDISRPEGFLERQVLGWIKRYEKAKTDEVPHVEQLTAWLAKHIPSSLPPTIIHYDFKLNNAMFSPSFTEMNGLFDWEMATIGDPLADLGVALSYWIQEDDPSLLKQGFGKPPVTVLPGFYTRQQFAEQYAKRSGRDLQHLNYYITFAYFKLAVIAQQIYYRYKMGQTKDPRFARFNETVASLITHGRETSLQAFR